MDLHKELEEFKELWSNRTPLGKLALSMSFILSIMSVGSLADTVYSFKGFIVYGFKFYRDLSEPIRIALSNFIGISISQANQDLLVLLCLFLGIFSKVKHSEPEIITDRSLLTSMLISVLGAAAIGYFFITLMFPIIGQVSSWLIAYPTVAVLMGLVINKPIKM